MRRLLLVLAALVLLAPTARAAEPARVAYDPVVHIESAGRHGLKLSTTEAGVVSLRPGTGGPSRQWRIYHMAPGTRVAVVSMAVSGCLTAVAPQDVRMVGVCEGAPNQVWTEHRLLDDSATSFALENTGHPGQCLTGVRPFARVELTACDSGRGDQFWIAVLAGNP
ncbi:RICIN domain-containing protein [Saccharothrix sp. BKS2]|uniref:hypothetical protein n=1 Tax=Saccharothrix sp. BKS2 TaxID=3064400 RepID=UPI0039E8680C